MDARSASRDAIKIGRRECREVAILGHVLAQHSVDVLLGVSLPGTAGTGEVDLNSGVNGEASVIVLKTVPCRSARLTTSRSTSVSRPGWIRLPKRVARSNAGT
jgi:hypothetical protein